MGEMNRRFDFTELSLPGLTLIQRKRIGDTRGYLERLFCSRDLVEAGWTVPIAQINQTYTARKGAVRGMHFQYPPHAEKKLVMCLKGRVYDVALDIRKGSPTFLQWHSESLCPESSNALLIPEGFAHGFQTLTPDVLMLYCHSALYEPESEAGIHPNDPAINISWPAEIIEMSARDSMHPYIGSTFEGFAV